MTGGAGAVGSHVVDALVEAGAAEVRVLDLADAEWDRNLAGGRGAGRVRRSPAMCATEPPSTPPMEGVDLVFHQAALRVTRCAEEPRLAHEVMADGTFHVVDAAARAGVVPPGRGVVGGPVRAGRDGGPARELAAWIGRTRCTAR